MESVLLERYRPVLQSVVLELVPGGSRLTEELVHQARSYIGLGPSSAVIGVCRQMYRTGTFIRADISDLDQFEPDAFNAVVAGRCAIDGLDEEHRKALLERLHRVLSPDGLLIFSSHNKSDQDAPSPSEPRSGRFGGGFLRGFRLRSSRAPMDEQDLGDELLSGIDGYLSAPQYRISRDDQERQLSELGFRLAECVDLEGHSVGPGDPAVESPELHYVIRPVGPRSAFHRVEPSS